MGGGLERPPSISLRTEFDSAPSLTSVQSMNSNPSQVRIAAVLGALAVALGAFGAHALAGVLTANGTLEVWKTASHYHFFHVLALLVMGATGLRSGLSFSLLTAGMVVFSGSLYSLAVTNIKWLGAITPIGGVLMIAGWLVLACKAGGTANR